MNPDRALLAVLLRGTARGLLLGAALAFSTGCRSMRADGADGVPPAAQRHAVEKPWTKAGIESHEYLWLELGTGKRGVMTGPVLATDDAGEYLTTKSDPGVHLPLSDVLVMDAVDVSASGPPTPTVQTAAGSLLAFWGGVIFFVPTILLILLFA